ncbi:hypothetical protein FRX31_021010 [Thalictrum thalictroides]|uniref:Uncharacterized protein n=1 Tax=Thalictrum thalictroides TaxID=46969 RepID=A0A7J6VWB6_THATH|nr:hypothetical protein FRX31_021010 [Thalictrum thalictroides]
MENYALVCSPKLTLFNVSGSSIKGLISLRRPLFANNPHHLFRKRRDSSSITTKETRFLVAAAAIPKGTRHTTNASTLCTNGHEAFASISSSSGSETSSVGVRPEISVPPPSSTIGSPLFWIGVGVGLSALFSWVAANLKVSVFDPFALTRYGCPFHISIKVLFASIKDQSNFAVYIESWFDFVNYICNEASFSSTIPDFFEMHFIV